jgi:hypothetical protein
LYSYVPVPPLAAAVKVTDVPGDCGLEGDGDGANVTAVAGGTGVEGVLSV